MSSEKQPAFQRTPFQWSGDEEWYEVCLGWVDAADTSTFMDMVDFRWSYQGSRRDKSVGTYFKIVAYSDGLDVVETATSVLKPLIPANGDISPDQVCAALLAAGYVEIRKTTKEK